MATALYKREDLPAAAARLLVQREIQRRGLGWQRSAADEALYQACRWDYALFAKSFLPHWCPDAFNQLHTDYYERLRERQGSRGHFDAVAAPRGFSKTTGCCLISIIHDCVYETEAYTLYLTNRHEDAVNKTRDARDELENNEALIRVYSPQMSPQWNNGDWTTAHGQRVRAASRHTQLRGALSKGRRPSRVILDDVEHFEHVDNAEQRAKDWLWLNNDILKLGDARTNYEMWGTLLHTDAMLKKLLSTPGWTAQLYQAVERFADVASLPLWQHWRLLYIDLSDPDRERTAQVFFLAHTSEMLQGSRVLWPQRRGYYDLMCARIREGESSFQRELQNAPGEDSRHLFDMSMAAYCDVRPHGIARAGGKLIPWTEIVEMVMSFDPVPDKQDTQGTDFAAIPVLAQDRDGYLYLLDCYLEQEISSDNQVQALVDLAWKWDCKLVSVETNGFASLIPANIREAMHARATAEQTPEFSFSIVAIVNMRSKILRIKSLETLVENGWLQFATTLDPRMIQQFADWLPLEQSSHDDGPDAVEMAIRTIRHQYERRDMV